MLEPKLWPARRRTKSCELTSPLSESLSEQLITASGTVAMLPSGFGTDAE